MLKWVTPKSFAVCMFKNISTHFDTATDIINIDMVPEVIEDIRLNLVKLDKSDVMPSIRRSHFATRSEKGHR